MLIFNMDVNLFISSQILGSDVANTILPLD